jgi:hypothetical protein
MLMPFTGVFAFNYYTGIKKLRSLFTYSRGVRKGNGDIARLKSLRRDIIGMMNDIYDSQKAQP